MSRMPVLAAASNSGALAQVQERRARHRRAVGYSVASSACFSVLDTMSKLSADFSPLSQTLFVRYAVQLALTLAWWFVWLRPRFGMTILRTEHPRFHMARALLLTMSTGLAVAGLRYLPLGEFTAVGFIAPMLAMVLAGWLLRERISRVQWICALLGFVGVLVVIRPGAGIFGAAIAFPICLAMVGAGYQTLTRRLAVTNEHQVVGQAFLGVMGFVIFSIPLFWPGSFVWSLSPWQWLILLGIGVAGTVGHFSLLCAFGLDSPAGLAPFAYIQIGFAMLAGWLVFSHAPDGWAVLGMAVIVGSGVASAVLRRH